MAELFSSVGLRFVRHLCEQSEPRRRTASACACGVHMVCCVHVPCAPPPSRGASFGGGIGCGEGDSLCARARIGIGRHALGFDV